MADPHPEKCIPWPQTLVALLSREGGAVPQDRFLDLLKGYFGAHRWGPHLSEDVWDKFVHASLQAIPEVLVEGDVGGTPVLPKGRPRDLEGLGDLFLGLKSSPWEVAQKVIVWRMRQRGDLSWMLPALEGRISPLDLVMATRPDLGKSSHYNWARSVQNWVDDLGPVQAPLRRYVLAPGVKVKHSFTKKLGHNVTALWVAHHDIISYCTKQLGQTFSISRNGGVLGEQIADAVLRKMTLNSGARYIVTGTLTPSVFGGWTKRTVINTLRDLGRDPSSRSILGALTDRERRLGRDRQDYQIAVDPDFLLAKIADPSISPDRMDALELEDRVMAKLGEVFGDEEGTARFLEVFQAFYRGDDVPTIAKEEGIGEDTVREMLGVIRERVAPFEGQFLDFIGEGEETFAYHPIK